MKTIYITLILSFLFLNNCKDEPDSNERGQNLLNFYLLSQPPFLRPNYCGQPQLMLEEGVTYNITLEPGKRYWFDYAVRSQVDSNVRNKFRVFIDKESNANLDYHSKSCYNVQDSGAVTPVSISSNQIIYEHESFRYTSVNDLTFYLVSISENQNISIRFIQF